MFLKEILPVLVNGNEIIISGGGKVDKITVR